MCDLHARVWYWLVGRFTGNPNTKSCHYSTGLRVVVTFFAVTLENQPTTSIEARPKGSRSTNQLERSKRFKRFSSINHLERSERLESSLSTNHPEWNQRPQGSCSTKNKPSFLEKLSEAELSTNYSSKTQKCDYFLRRSILCLDWGQAKV